jgi:hypothetical protein
VSQPQFPSYPARPGPTVDPYERSAGDAELRREAGAAVEASRDLGHEYDDAIAAGLADKGEQLAAYRTAELRAQAGQQAVESDATRMRRNQRFALGIVSLGTGVPITAIAAVNVHPGLLGVLVAWAGIVGVNVAAAWNGQRR